MRSTFFLFLILVILNSCTEEDNQIPLSLCDCATQRFSIEFIDAQGNNLIANETYSIDNIVFLRGFDHVNFYFNEASGYLEFEGFNVGENNYEIRLNDSETDTLFLDASLPTTMGEESCCSPFLNIDLARYNNILVEIDRGDENFAFDDKIVIIKL